MSYWRDDVEPFEGDGPRDSVLIEYPRPFRDDEAEQLESLCEQAAPGPFVVGDTADGEGRLFATLTDGRQIINRKLGFGHHLESGAVDATARLFCQARHLIMRFLEERRQWKSDHTAWQQERDELLGRIEELERTLASRERGQRAKGSVSASTGSSVRPR